MLYRTIGVRLAAAVLLLAAFSGSVHGADEKLPDMWQVWGTSARNPRLHACSVPFLSEADAQAEMRALHEAFYGDGPLAGDPNAPTNMRIVKLPGGMTPDWLKGALKASLPKRPKPGRALRDFQKQLNAAYKRAKNARALMTTRVNILTDKQFKDVNRLIADYNRQADRLANGEAGLSFKGLRKLPGLTRDDVKQGTQSALTAEEKRLKKEADDLKELQKSIGALSAELRQGTLTTEQRREKQRQLDAKLSEQKSRTQQLQQDRKAWQKDSQTWQQQWAPKGGSGPGSGSAPTPAKGPVRPSSGTAPPKVGSKPGPQTPRVPT